MDYSTRNGWTIRFRKNVHMYYHDLQATKAGRTLVVPCEDTPDRYTAIWPYQLKLDGPEMLDLLDALREWADQSGLHYCLYTTPKEYLESWPLPKPVMPAWSDVVAAGGKGRSRRLQRGDDALAQFFGGYFNQDWMLDDDTWQEVVERFVKESSAEHVASVSAGIDKLLATAQLDERLFEALQDLGCDYWAGSPGETRQWLTEIAAQLAQRQT
jgi:hypothetical protein